jgi:DNA-binding GntR family transcriptional regulator
MGGAGRAIADRASGVLDGAFSRSGALPDTDQGEADPGVGDDFDQACAVPFGVPVEAVEEVFGPADVMTGVPVGLVEAQHVNDAELPGHGVLLHSIPRGDTAGSSFAEEMRKSGLVPRTPLADLSTVPAPADVAERLEINAGDPVVRRTRHMFASDRPVQLATSYIPLAVAGSQDIALPDTGPTGLYKRLAAQGYPVARFVEEIEARQPRADEAAFLGLTEAQHVLEVTRVAYTKDDMPIETVINVFPSQQWRLSYEWSAE